MLLAALASVKKVGDLQAFLVDDSCLEFRPADSHVILRLRPGYVPKVPTTPFRVQVVNLQVLPREEVRICVLLLLLSSVPFDEPSWSSSRTLGSQVIPHVYSSMVWLPSLWARVFPWQNHLPSLLCIDLTPGWLSLPQRRPHVVLPLVSPYSGYGKYSDPLKFFTLCYIAAIC